MRADILLDENWELQTFAGDFDVESSTQEAKLVIFANKGDWRQSPLVGAGFRSSKNSSVTSQLNREVKLQLENIGLSNITVSLKIT